MLVQLHNQKITKRKVYLQDSKRNGYCAHQAFRSIFTRQSDDAGMTKKQIAMKSEGRENERTEAKT